MNPRREINAYGNEQLYKIQAVTVIPPLRKTISEEKRHQSKQSNSKLIRRPFRQALEDACEAEQQRDIHICSSGYTKDALPLNTLISMREYR